MTPLDERRHLLELSRVSGVSLDSVIKIVNAQTTMALRDLTLRKQAQTVLGALRVEAGKVVLVHPNDQLARYKDERGLTDKVYEEIMPA